jgi:glycosyltransferase involved in cell wall biosynthesis
MKLSIIIPAFNEEKLLPRCLEEVFTAMRENAADDWTGEVIVADNNSTDQTAAIARSEGARVVFEPINQIGRARNAGASIALGDWFLFVDADSFLHTKTLAELIRCIRQGAVAGGGCLVDLDEKPWIGTPAIGLWNLISRTMRWAAGSFVFCRADAFRAVGGFSPDLFAAEEIRFSIDLKHWAKANGLKVVVLREQRHISSGRKFRLYSKREILRHLWRSGMSTHKTIRNKEKLEFFYDGRR